MLKTKMGLRRLRAGRDVIFKAFIGALYGALTMCPVILRVGGGAAKAELPTFTYTGIYTLLDDGDGNWVLLTSHDEIHQCDEARVRRAMAREFEPIK